MKPATFFLALAVTVIALVAPSSGQAASGGLKLELRTSSSRVLLGDDIVVSAFFRSPEKRITMWNSFGWNVQSGLCLQVFDLSGHKVKEFYQMYDVLPPDRTGKGDLVEIGGTTFVGFDTQIPANLLFLRPGKYTIKCIYTAPLPRNYFAGSTIWGKEDGAVESPSVRVEVAEK